MRPTWARSHARTPSPECRTHSNVHLSMLTCGRRRPPGRHFSPPSLVTTTGDPQTVTSHHHHPLRPAWSNPKEDSQGGLTGRLQAASATQGAQSAAGTVDRTGPTASRPRTGAGPADRPAGPAERPRPPTRRTGRRTGRQTGRQTSRPAGSHTIPLAHHQRSRGPGPEP